MQNANFVSAEIEILQRRIKYLTIHCKRTTYRMQNSLKPSLFNNNFHVFEEQKLMLNII